MIKPHGNRTNQTLAHFLDAQFSKNESHVVLQQQQKSGHQPVIRSSNTFILPGLSDLKCISVLNTYIPQKGAFCHVLLVVPGISTVQLGICFCWFLRDTATRDCYHRFKASCCIDFFSLGLPNSPTMTTIEFRYHIFPCLFRTKGQTKEKGSSQPRLTQTMSVFKKRAQEVRTEKKHVQCLLVGGIPTSLKNMSSSIEFFGLSHI